MQIHPILSAKMSQSSAEVLPVIIYAKRSIAEIRDCIAENYGQIKYELPFINAVAVEISKEKIGPVAMHKRIRLITDDAMVIKSETPSRKAFTPPNRRGMPSGRQVLSSAYAIHDEKERSPDFYTKRGRGVGVAVIDTGIMPHYDLIMPQNRIIAFKDFINNRQEAYDDDGHGTHVAGIIAGNGYVSQKYIGSAPCANLIGIKALDGSGNGTTSDILAALQWVINNRRAYNIRVINLSLGISTDLAYQDDPLIKGANAAVKHGLTVVAAAGNNGPGKCTINSPGTSPYVITVGAADLSKTNSKKEISIADFSSRGPTKAGIVKPDILASGVGVISLDAKNPKGYTSESGTSMAAPAVSGAAAALYGLKPNLTPMQVKRILMQKAWPLKKENRNAQGHGLLNYEIFFDL